MDNRVSLDSNTVQAYVAVLEDHDETVNSISEKLETDGKFVQVAKTLDRFETIIKAERKFDVCSIDWAINERYIGSSALSLLRAYEKDAGKLVYSVHANRIKSAAYSEGADVVLWKIGENYDEYRAEVEKLARLGISRQIRTRLANLGHPFEKDFTLQSAEEADLMTKARELVRQKTLAGEDDELITLLRRRGWWLSFKRAAYSNLPTWEKLTLLFNYVNAQEDDITRMLGCSQADTKRLLDEKIVSDALEPVADEMLSILAYLLRLSKYEPELMPYYWKVANLFSKSLSSPPWDASGLYQYLRMSGANGIRNALYWIRSH